MIDRGWGAYPDCDYFTLEQVLDMNSTDRREWEALCGWSTLESPEK